MAIKLAAADIVLARRVGENDTLYGSVTSADIAEALTEKGFDIEKRKIVLPEPLKQVGEFEVAVKIHHDVPAHVKVKIVALGAAQPAGAAAPAPESPAQ